jgi:ADP-ribose pyrophosphatase
MREQTIRSKTVFEGRIMRIEVLTVKLPDGRTATREIVRHGPAVAVIARRSDGRFVFIRQFRKAMERICFEAMAGNCDPGENAESAAIRELREETGYEAELIRPLGPIYPSVGYCDERIDIFYAETGETPGKTDFDHDEEIETVLLTEKEVDSMIRRGDVQDAKTLAAWMLYKNGMRSA